jgi:hypothetical protein
MSGWIRLAVVAALVVLIVGSVGAAPNTPCGGASCGEAVGVVVCSGLPASCMTTDISPNLLGDGFAEVFAILDAVDGLGLCPPC